jgi:hypothetical protein
MLGPSLRARVHDVVAWVLPSTVASATLVLLALAVAGFGDRRMAGLVLAAGVLSWALCPLVARLACRVGAAVLPGGRSVHMARTPLLGGLAIYAPLCAYLAWTGGS